MPAQEHAAAFTVAKAMRLDVLRKSAAPPTARSPRARRFRTFGARSAAQLQDKGWWGKREMVDPVTGETVNAQLGSDARLRKIFDTNVSTAYSEGSERIQRNIELFPYLQYLRSSSEHPRLSHAPLPAASCVQTIPGGKRTCRSRHGASAGAQLTARQVSQMGLEVSEAPPERYVEYTNTRTGETMDVPVGVHPAQLHTGQACVAKAWPER